MYQIIYSHVNVNVKAFKLAFPFSQFVFPNVSHDQLNTKYVRIKCTFEVGECGKMPLVALVVAGSWEHPPPPSHPHQPTILPLQNAQRVLRIHTHGNQWVPVGLTTGQWLVPSGQWSVGLGRTDVHKQR